MATWNSITLRETELIPYADEADSLLEIDLLHAVGATSRETVFETAPYPTEKWQLRTWVTSKTDLDSLLTDKRAATQRTVTFTSTYSFTGIIGSLKVEREVPWGAAVFRYPITITFAKV